MCIRDRDIPYGCLAARQLYDRSIYPGTYDSDAGYGGIVAGPESPVSYTHLDVYKRQPKDRTGWETLLVLGIACVVLPAVSSDQKLKRQQDEKQKQLLEDYPSLVAKLTVLIGAGMTVRRAWERIWADYTGTEARCV